MPGVLIALSVRRDVTLIHTLSLIDLFMHIPDGDHLMLVPKWNDSLIERPRGVLATYMLEEPEFADYDVLVTLDDDIGFSTEMFWKVVNAARSERAIVSGVYATRSRNSHIACRLMPGTTLEFTNGGPSRLTEIYYATTGLMAVPREVFERMRDHRFLDADGGHTVRRYEAGSNNDPYWGFYAPFDVIGLDGRPEHLSEDYAICERARQLGYRIYADTSFILEHEGPIAVTVADVPRIGQGLIPTGDPMIDSLPDDLAAFWPGSKPQLLKHAMFGARELYGDHWLAWRAEHPDADEKEWYALDEVGEIYCLELMRWHLTGGGTPSFLVDKAAGKRVLDYGCGIATFGLRAAAQGARVLAVDVNAVTTRFAAFRARRHGLDTITGSTKPVSMVPFVPPAFTAIASDMRMPEAYLHAIGPFEVIHCWHVLEHVPDPMALVDELYSLLTPGGLLIADWDFHKNQDDPMHHNLREFGEIDDFRTVVEGRGFAPEGTPHVWVKTPL